MWYLNSKQKIALENVYFIPVVKKKLFCLDSVIIWVNSKMILNRQINSVFRIA